MHRRSSAATRPTPDAIAKLIHGYTPEYLRQHREALLDARLVWARATLGRDPFGAEDDEALSSKMTSLLPTWLTFWDTSRGLSGAELAARSPRYGAPVLRAAISALAAAQGVFGEVIALEQAKGVVVLRDLLVDRVVVLRSGGETLRLLRRWARVVTLAVPMGDGTWMQPSVVHAGDGFDMLSPDDVLAVAARACGIPRVAPVDFGVLTRRRAIEVVPALIREAEGRMASRAPQRRYLTTSEGDRFEPIRAVFSLNAADDAAVASNFRAARDMMVSPSGNAFFWLDLERREGSATEALAEVKRVAGKWEVRVSSEARLTRVAGRIAAALGRPAPSPTVVEHARPWEENPTLVDAPGPEVQTLAMKSLIPDGGAAAPTLGNAIRRESLDREIPLLGGRPRDLVATEEGRARVEAWLRDMEKTGSNQSQDASVRQWLDADPLRAELGLPTVASRYDLPHLMAPVR